MGHFLEGAVQFRPQLSVFLLPLLLLGSVLLLEKVVVLLHLLLFSRELLTLAIRGLNKSLGFGSAMSEQLVQRLDFNNVPVVQLIEVL